MSRRLCVLICVATLAYGSRPKKSVNDKTDDSLTIQESSLAEVGQKAQHTVDERAAAGFTAVMGTEAEELEQERIENMTDTEYHAYLLQNGLLDMEMDRITNESLAEEHEHHRNKTQSWGCDPWCLICNPRSQAEVNTGNRKARKPAAVAGGRNMHTRVYIHRSVSKTTRYAMMAFGALIGIIAVVAWPAIPALAGAGLAVGGAMGVLAATSTIAGIALPAGLIGTMGASAISSQLCPNWCSVQQYKYDGDDHPIFNFAAMLNFGDRVKMHYERGLGCTRAARDFDRKVAQSLQKACFKHPWLCGDRGVFAIVPLVGSGYMPWSKSKFGKDVFWAGKGNSINSWTKNFKDMERYCFDYDRKAHYEELVKSKEKMTSAMEMNKVGMKYYAEQCKFEHGQGEDEVEGEEDEEDEVDEDEADD